MSAPENGLVFVVFVKAALNSITSNAKVFASDAKPAFASRSAALRHPLSSLGTEISSAQGQPPLTPATEVVSPVTIGPTSEELDAGSKLPRLPADGLARA